MISKPITLQTWERNDDLQPVRIMQGDAMSRVLKITLASNGAPVDLTNTAVSAHFLRPQDLQSFLPAEIVDPLSGLVQVTLTSQISAVPGIVNLIVRVVKADPSEVLFSGTARIEVMQNSVDDSAAEATNEFTALTVALAQVQGFEGRIDDLETGKIDIAEKAAPNGVATLDTNGKIVQMPTATDVGAIPVAEKGMANGVATLDSAGKLVQVPLMSNLLNLIYPIGSIYLSISAANPETLFGGTWERIAQGQTLVGVNSSDTDFNAAGKTGGEKAHILTIPEMPAHNHGINFSKNVGAYANPALGDGGNTWGNSTNTVSNTGGGLAHNNMPPYITCYIWKRTA